MASVLEFANLAVVKFDALHFAIYDRLEVFFGVSHAATSVTSVVDDAILFGVQFLSCYLVVLLTLGPVLLTGYLCWRLTLNLFTPLPVVRKQVVRVNNTKPSETSANSGLARTKSGPSTTSHSPPARPVRTPSNSTHSGNLVVGSVVTGSSPAPPRTPPNAGTTFVDKIRTIFTPTPKKMAFHARARLSGKVHF